MISGLALRLRRNYEVTPAHSGAEGLDILRHRGPFAVVLSDMRMPGMDGASFLARARHEAPDTVRLLLTGHADMQSAIAAVNDGQIFRFLTKPCPADQLRLAVDAAAEQYRLVTAERVLLEQTLHGSIKALVDILALTSPASFGRAMRLKRLVGIMAADLGSHERWQVEAAAMLSQLGCVSLPPDTAERFHLGHALSPDEECMVTRVPSISGDLLADIPRIDAVRSMIASADTAADTVGTVTSPLVILGGRMLRTALLFDLLELRGDTSRAAIEKLRGQLSVDDAELLDRVSATRHDPPGTTMVRDLPIASIRVGMLLAEDVRLSSGALLAARGYEVTASFVERVRNQAAGTIAGPLRVVVPAHVPLV